MRIPEISVLYNGREGITGTDSVLTVWAAAPAEGASDNARIVATCLRLYMTTFDRTAPRCES